MSQQMGLLLVMPKITSHITSETDSLQSFVGLQMQMQFSAGLFTKKHICFKTLFLSSFTLATAR